MTSQILALDAEWEFGPQFVGDRDKVSVIQISGRISASQVQAYILQVRTLQKLSIRLESLLNDENITFIGRNVSQDISKIQNDFKSIYQHISKILQQLHHLVV